MILILLNYKVIDITVISPTDAGKGQGWNLKGNENLNFRYKPKA